MSCLTGLLVVSARGECYNCHQTQKQMWCFCATVTKNKTSLRANVVFLYNCCQKVDAERSGNSSARLCQRLLAAAGEALYY